MNQSSDLIRVLSSLDPVRCEFANYADVHADELGMQKPEYLRHCRRLRDLGFARLSVLFDPDDGRPKGSAYLRTKKGAKALALSIMPMAVRS